VRRFRRLDGDRNHSIEPNEALQEFSFHAELDAHTLENRKWASGILKGDLRNEQRLQRKRG
jgi:hypothetical protein